MRVPGTALPWRVGKPASAPEARHLGDARAIIGVVNLAPWQQTRRLALEWSMCLTARWGRSTHIHSSCTVRLESSSLRSSGWRTGLRRRDDRAHGPPGGEVVRMAGENESQRRRATGQHARASPADHPADCPVELMVGCSRPSGGRGNAHRCADLAAAARCSRWRRAHVERDTEPVGPPASPLVRSVVISTRPGEAPPCRRPESTCGMRRPDPDASDPVVRTSSMVAQARSLRQRCHSPDGRRVREHSTMGIRSPSRRWITSLSTSCSQVSFTTRALPARR